MSVNSSRVSLLNVVTSSLMVGLLRCQLQYLHDRGFDVTVVSPRGKALEDLARSQLVKTLELPIARKIAPLQDLASLWRLWRAIRELRPTITNVGTPKAGLLGGLVAWLNRVPCRFYTLRGLRFETTQGWKRRLLIFAERLSCFFAHRVICVSNSVRENALAAGLTKPHKAVVFASGSSNGVDVQRFCPSLELMRRAAELRCHLGIPSEAPVLGFVGRLTCDKGIPELVDAFLRLRRQFPDLHLLLLGRFEHEDPLPNETRRCLETHRAVVLPGHKKSAPSARKSHSTHQRREDWPVDDTPPYYALMDVFVLPSHREGFPNVVLEAQAMGTPVVAAAATGSVDAILDGETGLLFPIRDAAALAEAVARLLTDKPLASKLSLAARHRVEREFRQEVIWEALLQEYRSLLCKRDLHQVAITDTRPVADLQ